MKHLLQKILFFLLLLAGAKVFAQNVLPSFNQPNSIVGEENPCTEELSAYTLSDAEGLTSFFWQVTEGAIIYAGQYSATAQIIFNDASQPCTLTLVASNDEGDSTFSLVVFPQPSYNITFTDTISVHSEFHKNGFDVPIQDSAGVFQFTQNHTTLTGCDSTLTQILYVFNNPFVTIIGDSLICNGQTTTLHAFSEGASFSEGGFPPEVAVGDILCTDSTIVKPDDYPTSGKTAKGVVFFVDYSGLHGWAVALNDASDSCRWGPHTESFSFTSNDDVPGVSNFPHSRTVIYDIDGMSNTSAIRIKYWVNFSDCQAAYSCYFYNHLTGSVGSTHHGWYLPAAGQLNALYATIHVINPSIGALGGTQFPTNNNGMSMTWCYWSSSEYDYYQAWGVSYMGMIYAYRKYYYNYLKARAVCTF